MENKNLFSLNKLYFKKFNTPGSIYQYSNLAPRLSCQNCKLFSFFCLSVPKRDLDTKKTTPNIEVCPESLGELLECSFDSVSMPI